MKLKYAMIGTAALMLGVSTFLPAHAFVGGGYAKPPKKIGNHSEDTNAECTALYNSRSAQLALCEENHNLGPWHQSDAICVDCPNDALNFCFRCPDNY